MEQADSEVAARAALDAFERASAKRYPAVGASGRRNGQTLRPFLELPPELRRNAWCDPR